MTSFVTRHIGSRLKDINLMLKTINCPDIHTLMNKVIPEQVLNDKPLGITTILENNIIDDVKSYNNPNPPKSYIGQGFYASFMPNAIKRNILENPRWYTAYTPYQAEISAGRLEMQFNFQHMVSDLTGLARANVSMLDESSSAGEAMIMAFNVAKKKKNRYIVDENMHPQNINVIKTIANPLNINVDVQNLCSLNELPDDTFGITYQYPDTNGLIFTRENLIQNAKQKNITVVAVADLIPLCYIKPPGYYGADICVGSTQTFGLPLGYGGPHSSFFTFSDKFLRQAPGKIIGKSVCSDGEDGLRMSVQTREQHIRRDKATSNICTTQSLIAVLSTAYGMYHGPNQLHYIAELIYKKHIYLNNSLINNGYDVIDGLNFNTTKINIENAIKLHQTLLDNNINVRLYDNNSIGISVDETTDYNDIATLLNIMGCKPTVPNDMSRLSKVKRDIDYLQHEIFNKYHSETEFTRYLTKLVDKDITLADSMIPLGSCTMKLNSANQLEAMQQSSLLSIHPYSDYSTNVKERLLINKLNFMLRKITGFDEISFQPNSGSQGEYLGLRVMMKHFESIGENRNICLIPKSAHGTNPASATKAGLKSVMINMADDGSIDINDLKAKINKHGNKIMGIMITYPSTYGIFDTNIKDICDMVHENGSLVYIDGANMNAQVGYCKPADIGDVCHLNLHKTFCIPHGGGGPGMGPIGVKDFLIPYLPGKPEQEPHKLSVGPIASAEFSSASLLPIVYSYISLMGDDIKQSTQIAILNANYMMYKLKDHYNIKYTNNNNYVSHEFIVDVSKYKKYKITFNDIAKRLQDYSYHAPTIGWPISDCLMIEPTESESIEEMDRFCDALIQIKKEMDEVIDGKYPLDNNVIVNSPHTLKKITGKWDYPYDIEKAVYPLDYLKDKKRWPAVSRIDEVYGDTNLVTKYKS